MALFADHIDSKYLIILVVVWQKVASRREQVVFQTET